MTKKIDPRLVEILKEYGERAEEALWDCHGTWVAYHKAIERVAAKAGIIFDMPQIIEADSVAKVVAIAVKGKMGEREEWSFGEASPGNNKNSYPYAMAEKRAKDRVVLKLVGLHGLVYSEEESDDFKPKTRTELIAEVPDRAPSKDDAWKQPRAPLPPPPRKENGLPQKGYREDGSRTAYALKTERPQDWPELGQELAEAKTVAELEGRLWTQWRRQANEQLWPQEFYREMVELFGKRKAEIKAEIAAMDDKGRSQLPTEEQFRASVSDAFQSTLMAGE